MENPDKVGNYTVERRCSNCGHVNTAIFKRGERATDSVECVKCGCDTGPERYRERFF